MIFNNIKDSNKNVKDKSSIQRKMEKRIIKNRDIKKEFKFWYFFHFNFFCFILLHLAGHCFMTMSKLFFLLFFLHHINTGCKLSWTFTTSVFFLLFVKGYAFLGKKIEWLLHCVEFKIFLLLEWGPTKAREPSLHY